MSLMYYLRSAVGVMGDRVWRHRGTRLVLGVCCLCACQQGVTPDAFASAQRRPSKPATSVPPPPANQSASVEFDLPAEFSTRSSDGTYVVTGFRVAVFQSGNPAPLQTVDVSRDHVTVKGQLARVPLPELPSPAALKDATVRVQTLTHGQPSEWSEAVSLAAVATARPVRADMQAPRQRQDLTAADVEGHPMLADALRKLLSPETKLEDGLKGFQRLDDLAMAVALSGDNDIPFKTLSESVRASKGVALRRVLKKLRPQLDVKAALSKARSTARQLLGPAEKKKKAK